MNFIYHWKRNLTAFFLVAVIGAVGLTLYRTGAKLPPDKTAQSLQCVVPGSRPLKVAPFENPEDRRRVLTGLEQALAEKNDKQIAFFNGSLAQEALNRLSRLLEAWGKKQDVRTGLFPRSLLRAQGLYWNSKDSAADFFPHLYIAAAYLDQAPLDPWNRVFVMERRLCGRLPQTVSLSPFRMREEPLNDRIFGAAEYAKDGLVSIAERLGTEGPWYNRLKELTDAILEDTDVVTQFGSIPSMVAEVNGDMLQVLPRLYWSTRKERYLEMAERIADAYLLEVLPKNHGFSAQKWDFQKHMPLIARFRLRDHGNELVPGLSELYFVEKALSRPKARIYKKLIRDFLDRILITGRSPEGLWFSMIDPESSQPLSKQVIDVWGYLLIAYKTFDLTEGTHTYDAEIVKDMRAVSRLKNFPWEGPFQDGYADSLESMLYLLPWYPLPECRKWLDEEMETLFRFQKADGFVEYAYLDGNFARTALLYAAYKMQGVRMAPWRDDLHLGASHNLKDNALYLCLGAQKNWRGRLFFDTPRHRSVWTLPHDYPRLNSSPEWFTVESSKTYAVQDLDDPAVKVYSGKEMAEGIPVELNSQRPVRYLKIFERSQP